MKKKISFLAIFLIISLVFCSCATTSKPGISRNWQINENISNTANEDITTMFDEAKKDTAYENYKLINFLGSQVVAGTNYILLCYDDKATYNPFKTITIYNDLENHHTITGSKEIDLFALYNTTPKTSTLNKNLAGGWVVNYVAKGEVLPREINETFNKAVEGDNTKAQIKPLHLLGSQTVNEDTIYAFICLSIIGEVEVSTNSTINILYIRKDKYLNANVIQNNEISLADYAQI